MTHLFIHGKTFPTYSLDWDIVLGSGIKKSNKRTQPKIEQNSLCYTICSSLLSILSFLKFISNWKIMASSAYSVQFISVAQWCPTLCDPMNRSTPGIPVHHQLLEFTQTHVHRVSDAIQPSHPLSSPSPPAPNLSQHQSLFQWVKSSHEVAKVLEFQL